MPFPIETIEQMQGFFWVLLRVSIIYFFLPFFGTRGIPFIWKIGLSMITAIILAPVVPLGPSYPQTLPEIMLAIMGEVVMGLILAFGVRMLLNSVQLAGQFMAFQMGFAMARAMDPISGIQSTVLSQFLYLFTILIFFSLDGHHFFIRAMATSFYLVPSTTFSLNPSLSVAVIQISSQMFRIGLKIAAPIMVALFLSHLSLGIVARTVPQMNILMIGLPINITLGLIIYGLILSNLFPLLSDLTRRMGEVLIGLTRLM